jgi:anion-transporting  ArsA/GET3 family ATPase
VTAPNIIGGGPARTYRRVDAATRGNLGSAVSTVIFRCMDVAAFAGQSRVLFVVGKGGVGKTTVTAALARLAAGAGLRVLVVALDDSGGLPALFAHEGFAYEEVPLDSAADQGDNPIRQGSVHARLIRPDDALVDYLGERSLGRVSRKLVSAGVIDVVSTAIPGIREILVLGKIKQIERGGTADLIIVDAPAAGHAVSLLTSAGGLFDAARGGPLRAQAVDVLEMLTDARRCQVLLVTLPEETPVNELVETAYKLEDEVSVKLSAVVVNGVYPVLEELDADPVEAARAAGVHTPSPEDAERLGAAASFRLARQQLQAEQIDRLAAELPLPLLELPYVFADSIGPDEVTLLADELATGVSLLASPVRR